MYVSTAYANCVHDKIEEKFYTPPYDYNGVISLVTTANDDKKLEAITPRYVILTEYVGICFLDSTDCECVMTIKNYFEF